MPCAPVQRRGSASSPLRRRPAGRLRCQKYSSVSAGASARRAGAHFRRACVPPLSGWPSSTDTALRCRDRLPTLNAMARDDEIAFPGDPGDERELLLAWLDYLRGAVLRKVRGLNDEDVRWRPDGCLIPLLGIVNHLAHVEWRWIDGGFLGDVIDRNEEEFCPGLELNSEESHRCVPRSSGSDERGSSIAVAQHSLPIVGRDDSALGAPTPHQRDRASRWSR